MAFNQTLLSFDYKSGIYCIKFTNKNKLYIGSTKDFKQRYEDHIYDLKKELHSNTHLQRAWNKYGEDNFLFEVLEEHDLSQFDKELKRQYLFNREQHYLNSLLKADENNTFFNKNSYNILRHANGGGYKDRKVLVFDLDMNFIESFVNPKEASYKYGEHRHAGIILCCNGKLGRVGKYIFRYEDKLDVKFTKKERKTGYTVKTKPIYRYDYETGFYIDEWKSQNEATKKLGIYNVSKILSGDYTNEKGFTFRYYKTNKIQKILKKTCTKNIQIFDIYTGRQFNFSSKKYASEVMGISLKTIDRRIKNSGLHKKRYYIIEEISTDV